MWPPAVDLERLNTASCCRSSRIWSLTSRSTNDATEGLHPSRYTPLAVETQKSGGQGGCELDWVRAGSRLGSRQLHQVFAGEAGVAERARLGLGRLVHAVAGEIAEAVGRDVFGDLLHRVRGGD